MGWLADFRWAMNAKRARRWRRGLGSWDRKMFDLALRERGEYLCEHETAFYEMTADDLIRAMRARGNR